VRAAPAEAHPGAVAAPPPDARPAGSTMKESAMTQLGRWVATAAVGGLAVATAVAGFGAPAPAAATDATTPVTVVEKLTGPDAPNNTWGRWDIKATDLG